ncbi:concanavalin A-like lectin/glucanase superfamily protein [Sinobacterium caligoides]|uniref:Concanavalin A-like lectin/glucanase superfamily protein n=1 Tax=Sinobacterium caligoides TaxID=933926 RepID=A0A3N2DQ18_9GAMM|nr:LamG-like jellyroll fold domain-containing protein [Sinobacterium caligoides]ROS01782.1 concanavalin A-like lectin/glucanase superfamily protein [Sinobacterium caligoides]
MSSVNDVEIYPLNSSDQLTGLSVVADERFKQCAELIGGGSELSLADVTHAASAERSTTMSEQGFTASVWVKRTEVGSAFSFLGEEGFSCDGYGRLSLLWEKQQAMLDVGRWHHILLRKSASSAELYLDGKKVGSLYIPDNWRFNRVYEQGSIVVMYDLINPFYESALWTGMVTIGDDVKPRVFKATRWARGDIPRGEGAKEGELNPWVEIDEPSGSWLKLNEQSNDFTYRVSQGKIRLAQQHMYPCLLNDQQAYQDYYSNLPPVLMTSKDASPLDVNIVTTNKGVVSTLQSKVYNKLYIEADHTQQHGIVFENKNSIDIVFYPFAFDETVEPENLVAGPDNYHLQLRFRYGTFVMSNDIPEIVIDNENMDNWHVSSLEPCPEDGGWAFYFLSKQETVLAASETLSFTLRYESADSALGARSTKMAFFYKGMKFDGGGEIKGDRLKQVDILNLSSNNPYIENINRSVIDANKKVDLIESRLLEDIGKISVADETLKKNYDKLCKQNTRYTIEADPNDSNIGNILAMLFEFTSELDKEVDTRAKVFNAEIDAAEKKQPLGVYYDAPRGLVCSGNSSIVITLLNKTAGDLTFNTDEKYDDKKYNAVVIKIHLPYGHGDKHSLANSSGLPSAKQAKVTNVDNLYYDFEYTGKSELAITFEWKVTKPFTLPKGGSIQLSIDDIPINDQPGHCPLRIEIMNLSGYADSSLTMPVLKTTNDLALLAGNGKVCIGSGAGEKSSDLEVSGDLQVSGALSSSGGILNLTSKLAAEQDVEINGRLSAADGTLNLISNLKTDNNVEINGDLFSSNGQLNIKKSLVVEERIHDEYGQVLGVPIGAVIMWHGYESDIPTGFRFCNGEHGTPDLRGRFIVGAENDYSAADDYSLDSEGGREAIELKTSEMPKHTHGVNDPGHHHLTYKPYEVWNSDTHSCDTGGDGRSDGHNHVNHNVTGISIVEEGGSEAHENRPPFYALYYIKRVS